MLNYWLPCASILFQIARICNSQFKCNYLKNKKLFPSFLLDFWNLHQILNVLKKNMIVIANLFPKLKTVKKLVGPLSKKSRFRTCFGSQHVKVSQILAKSQWERFFHVFSSFSEKLIWKISPLVLRKILGCLLNYWLPVRSILFKIRRSCNSQFKCNHLKKERFFWFFCSISGVYIKF